MLINMNYDYLKALHIIFVVTWFAGLFYIVRLFIYHVEAQEKGEDEKRILSSQFKIMQRRLWYGITWPSAIITFIFGMSLIHNFFPITEHPWLMAKVSFLVGLYSYHLFCHKIFKQLQNDNFNYSSTWLRVWNEVATIFLFAIVFLVELKDILDMGKGLIGLVLFSVVLMIAIKWYKKKRTQSLS